MLGSLAGLMLIPGIGIEKSFFVCALAYGLIALLIYNKKLFAQSRRFIPLHLLAGGAFLIAVSISPFGFMDERFLAISCASCGKATGERRVAVREGLTETTPYLQKDILGEPYYHRLLANNYSMSASLKAGKRYKTDEGQ